VNSADTALLDNEWHLAAAEFINSKMSIYIDGKLDTSITVPFPELTYDGGPHLFLGRHGNQNPGWDFQGSMDEVRISKKTYSASWHKFSYENQKPGSGVVRVE